MLKNQISEFSLTALALFVGLSILASTLVRKVFPEHLFLYYSFFYLSLVIFLFLRVYSGYHFRSTLLLLVISLLSLSLKIVPITHPTSRGLVYAAYAKHIVFTEGPTPLLNRWLGPSVAHWLGFSSYGGWLLFLLGTFLIGLCFLYISMIKITQNKVFSFVVTLIPIATTTGWFSVYTPGYPDWITFTLLTGALCVRPDRYALILCFAAILVHERAVFVVLTMPFMRALLHEQLSTKKILRNLRAVFIIIAIFFVINWKSLLNGFDPGSYGYYLKVLLFGGRGERISWEGYLLYILEAYKAIFIASSTFARIGIWIIILSSGLILGQLLVAGDGVRLLDLLIFPIILTMILVYRETPSLRKSLTFAIAIALCINQLLPVTYLSQFWNFIPESFVHDMWGHYKIPDYMLYFARGGSL